MNLEHCLEKIKQAHYPAPPLADAGLVIERWELEQGITLPPDMKSFYGHMNGCRLFDKLDPSYNFLSLEMVARARVMIFGRDLDTDGPADLYAFCSVRDGNYVAFNGRQPSGCLDCFHETFGEVESRRITESFTEFLIKALSSGSRLFWL